MDHVCDWFAKPRRWWQRLAVPHLSRRSPPAPRQGRRTVIRFSKAGVAMCIDGRRVNTGSMFFEEMHVAKSQAAGRK
jgi:hypothetical protein